MAIREKVYKVRLSIDEVEKLKDSNVLNIARFLRESALKNISDEKVTVNYFTKLDRDYLLELSRIGNNVNQIAKALNTDIANEEPFQVAHLLALLISINESLEDLRK